MQKKSPLGATIEELDQIARKAFSEHATNLASGKGTGSIEDFEVGVPFRLLKIAVEKLKKQKAHSLSREENSDTPPIKTKNENDTWDEFFRKLEPSEDFRLDRDQ